VTNVATGGGLPVIRMSSHFAWVGEKPVFSAT
jgi:hypothetical protein